MMKSWYRVFVLTSVYVVFKRTTQQHVAAPVAFPTALLVTDYPTFEAPARHKLE